MSSEKPQPPQTHGAQREADVYDLLAWLEVNKKKVLVVALLLVAAGFAIATMRYMREQREVKASGELLALRASLSLPTNAVPPQPSAFLKVAQDFSGTSAAERARLLAATAFFTDGKYSEAETEFSRFLKEYPSSPWAASAAYGVAAAQEAQNKAEAMASYQSVVTAYANSAVANEAKLALARIHETKKQPEQALRLYNELLAPKTGVPRGESGNPEAASRKEALLRAHPELSTNNLSAMRPQVPAFSAPNTGLSIPSAPDTNAAKAAPASAPTNSSGAPTPK